MFRDINPVCAEYYAIERTEGDTERDGQRKIDEEVLSDRRKRFLYLFSCVYVACVRVCVFRRRLSKLSF